MASIFFPNGFSNTCSNRDKSISAANSTYIASYWFECMITKDAEQMMFLWSVSHTDKMIRKWVRVSPECCTATSFFKTSPHFFHLTLSVQCYLIADYIFHRACNNVFSHLVTNKGSVCTVRWSILSNQPSEVRHFTLNQPTSTPACLLQHWLRGCFPATQEDC